MPHARTNGLISEGCERIIALIRIYTGFEFCRVKHKGRMNALPNFQMKANLATVFRGPITELQQLGELIASFIESHFDVQMVFQHTSASKLWIKEGGEMNEMEGVMNEDAGRT